MNYAEIEELADRLGGSVTRECFSEALQQYMATALWSSYDDPETGPLDDTHDVSDIADESRDEMARDVWDFLSTCWDRGLDLGPIEPGQIGHDFWLTRNHHGAGFWDRGLGELGDTLTEMAHAYGGSDPYVGDDGKIYLA